ncbi:MAG: HNH endonuclease [Oscillospiraceae bacterium]|nr:HNH endonuclease [Oscillospiraceae bacterium]
MGRVIRQCDWCGKAVARYPSQFAGRAHIFCSRECQHRFETKALNPDGYAKNFSKSIAFLREHAAEFNKHHMTPEVRSKLREARLGTGEGKTYTKFLGRHMHRVVAELMLGRPLKSGEVVHHIDGDKRNNRPENLMVFSSQKEHAAFHAAQKKEGGCV